MIRMNDQAVSEERVRLVSEMEALAEKLKQISDGFPAVERNVKRIQASIVMIKLNLGE